MPIDVERPNLHRIRLDRSRVDAGDWGSYPFTVPAIAAIPDIAVRSRVLFFAGENGSGKSTLLEGIAAKAGFAIGGGTANARFDSRGSEDADRLSEALSLSWTARSKNGYFLRAETLFNLASYLEEIGDRSPSLHRMSHGESFLTTFQRRFHGDGLYLLDEPEAALSIQRQLTLLVIVRDVLAASARAQFIIATHSPILLAYPGAQILTFDGDRIEPIAYEQTQPYVLTRSFLSDPKRYVHRLFAGGE
jgi:predicted ATPase